MSNKVLGLLAASVLLLSACGPTSNTEISANPPSNSQNSSSEALEDISSDSLEESYVRGEDGFYVLDPDMLSVVENEPGSVAYETEIAYEESTNLRLYESWNQIPLYLVKTNISHTFTPNNYALADNSVGIVRLNGEAHFTLHCAFSLRWGVTVRPLAKDVDYTIDEAKALVHFTIKEPGQYTFEFRSNATLHLFVDAMDEYEDEASPTIYFGPGLHTKDNSPYIGSDNMVRLSSNARVHVDYGAVIQGGFAANSASNIHIYGGGVVTGAAFDRDAEKDTRLIPWDFNYCTGITIEGVTTLDPAGWCYNLYFSKEITLTNIKIISSRANGDGVSVQSCSDFSMKDSFVRSWDDSLVVKNYPQWSNRNLEGTTRNISFDNCLIWTDLAQSMEIGYETVGDVMENIVFTNITVLHAHHMAAISIHNGNNSTVRDVSYENIVVEDAQLLGNSRGAVIEFTTTWSADFSDKQKVTALGQIENVKLKNVKILEGNPSMKVNVIGCMDTREAYYGNLHYIRGVTFEDVEILRKDLDDAYENLVVGDYVTDLEFI